MENKYFIRYPDGTKTEIEFPTPLEMLAQMLGVLFAAAIFWAMVVIL